MNDVASTSTARDRADRIRAKAADLLQEIADAFENRDHLALGYKTWGEYCRAEFDGRIALPRAKGDRRELVGALVDAGLSKRAVAEATGLSRNTVAKYAAPAQIEPPVDPYQGLFSALEFARTQAGDAWEVLSDEYVAEAIRDGQISPGEAVESMRRTMLAAKETQTGGHYRVPGTIEEAGEMATDLYVRELVTHHRRWWEIEGFPDRETAIKELL